MKIHLPRILRASGAGQTFTEFAMIATPLFLFVFGVMTVGSAVYSYNTLSNAAREAVRYAVVVPPANRSSDATRSAIKQVAVNYAVGLNLSPSNVTVTWPADPKLSLRWDAQVKIAYTYNLKVPFLSPLALNLTSTSRMLTSQ